MNLGNSYMRFADLIVTRHVLGHLAGLPPMEGIAPPVIKIKTTKSRSGVTPNWTICARPTGQKGKNSLASRDPSKVHLLLLLMCSIKGTGIHLKNQQSTLFQSFGVPVKLDGKGWELHVWCYSQGTWATLRFGQSQRRCSQMDDTLRTLSPSLSQVKSTIKTLHSSAISPT
jgi:hypothetical protein